MDELVLTMKGGAVFSGTSVMIRDREGYVVVEVPARDVESVELKKDEPLMGTTEGGVLNGSPEPDRTIIDVSPAEPAPIEPATPPTP